MELHHVHARQRHLPKIEIDALHGKPTATGAFQHHRAVGGVGIVLYNSAGQTPTVLGFLQYLKQYGGGVARTGIVTATDLDSIHADANGAEFVFSGEYGGNRQHRVGIIAAGGFHHQRGNKHLEDAGKSIPLTYGEDAQFLKSKASLRGRDPLGAGKYGKAFCVGP